MSENSEFYHFPRPAICPHCKLAVATENPFCERCGWDLISGMNKRLKRGSNIKCVYCQQIRGSSIEDIFPSWLTREFPNRTPRFSNTERRSAKMKAFTVSILHSNPKKVTTRPAYRLTTNLICEVCNNGWMSRLQAAMKPIMLGLISSSSIQLSEEQKEISARWACMTLTNLAYSENADTTLQYQRTCIMQGGLPKGWTVGIGVLNDASFAGRYERYNGAMPIGSFGDPFSPFTASYIVIENLIFSCIFASGDWLASLIEVTLGLSPEAYMRNAGLDPIWCSFDRSTGEQIYKNELSSSAMIIARATSNPERLLNEGDLLKLRITE